MKKIVIAQLVLPANYPPTLTLLINDPIWTRVGEEIGYSSQLNTLVQVDDPDDGRSSKYLF